MKFLAVLFLTLITTTQTYSYSIVDACTDLVNVFVRCAIYGAMVKYDPAQCADFAQMIYVKFREIGMQKRLAEGAFQLCESVCLNPPAWGKLRDYAFLECVRGSRR